jgi:hypothetical protein
MTSEYETACPHDDCGEVLFITWMAGYTLSPNETRAPAITDAHSEGWQIECAAGHVILLPGPRGCGCDDPEGPGCGHNPDDYDWSDETAILRDRDLGRLRDVMARIGATS